MEGKESMWPAGLWTCVSQDWTPQIGDPEATGWLTVAAYLICAALAVAVWRGQPDGRGRAFWGLIAAATLFLAVNKQLDLQTALTATARCLAHAQGWYEQRRIVQLAFIAAFLGLTVAGLWLGGRSLRGNLRESGVALIGLVVLAGFVMVRAIGFHHVDALIGRRQLGVSANFLFENAGLLLIALNAAAILLRRPGRLAGLPRRG